MKQIVLGTAGHIDHGKTTLIKALTGIETDRLKEEKARGITIELGFAHLSLPSGERLGIVDVPGHEKFVKNMVAGAAGIDLVALVIAADEGVMPQTREHLDICTLLGVRQGLVVLTKIDMVDEEWLELVSEDVREYLQGTFLAEAPIIPVSAVKGQGIDELVTALDQLVAQIAESPASGPFRLPVDRVFIMKGFGTVITGTAINGEVAVGQEVTIYPSGLSARVRGLQVHNQEVNTARRGQRTAMNLQGLEKAQINRGDVVAQTGALKPSLWVDVQMQVLRAAPRPIKHRAPIRFHSGSSEVMGRVMLLSGEEVAPGEEALCQVRLEDPVAVMAGDHYVLRSYSPTQTIAGGIILHPHPSRHKRNRPEIMADLAALRSGSPDQQVAVHARLAGLAGITAKDLVRLMSLPAKELETIIQQMLSKQELVRFDKDQGGMIAVQVWRQLQEDAQELLASFHKANPLKPGMSREEFKRRLLGEGESRLFSFLLNSLVEQNLVVAEKDLLRLAGHQVRLAADDLALRQRLEKAYQEGGVTPPTLREIGQSEDLAQARKLLAVLVNEGVLVKVKDELYYHSEALERLKGQLVDFLNEHQRIEAAQFKEITGLSRKFLIPLLEYFDATQVTMRVGDERVLRKK